MYNGHKVDPYSDISVIKAVNIMRKANDASSIRKLSSYLQKHDQRLRELQNQDITTKFRQNKSVVPHHKKQMLLPKESNESLKFEKIKKIEAKLTKRDSIEPMSITPKEDRNTTKTIDFLNAPKSTRNKPDMKMTMVGSKFSVGDRSQTTTSIKPLRIPAAKSVLPVLNF